MKNPSMTGKYTEKSDSKMDRYLTRKLNVDEKKEFEKKDTAHGKKKKPKTLQEDLIKDKGIIKGIMKERAHEKKEGKKGEKAEDKREAKAKKK